MASKNFGHVTLYIYGRAQVISGLVKWIFLLFFFKLYQKLEYFIHRNFKLFNGSGRSQGRTLKFPKSRPRKQKRTRRGPVAGPAEHAVSRYNEPARHDPPPPSSLSHSLPAAAGEAKVEPFWGMDWAQFRPLDEKSLLVYIKSVPSLAALLAGDDEELSRLQVKEVGDGNLNFVYIVIGPSGSFVLKQVFLFSSSEPIAFVYVIGCLCFLYSLMG